MRNLIAREALAMGLDPRAVLAVAAGEGGFVNREGDIGDLAGGGSYGPFQLYAQGALPSKYRGNPQKADAWAWSQPGIRYALSKMVAVGAAGLQGAQAIETIIRKFERPADPSGSIQRATSRYGEIEFNANLKQRAGQAFQQGPAAVVRGPNPAQALQATQQKVASLLQMSQNSIAGDFQSNWAMLGQLQQARRSLFQANQQVRSAEADASSTGGSAVPLSASGVQFETDDPTLQKILAAADAQVGKPYVWGAESPQEGGFDCSGLIDWAYRQAGIDLPGRLTTYTAMRMGVSVKGKQMQPGDWLITNGGKHMVMYVGNGKVIAAPRTGLTVRYQPISDFEGDIVDVRRVNVRRAASRVPRRAG